MHLHLGEIPNPGSVSNLYDGHTLPPQADFREGRANCTPPSRNETMAIKNLLQLYEISWRYLQKEDGQSRSAPVRMCRRGLACLVKVESSPAASA